jgi:hypothetical protein
VLRTIDSKNWMGDKAYIGNQVIAPFRKPEDRELLDYHDTDYRRPLNTFETTISAVLGLHFYRMT